MRFLFFLALALASCHSYAADPVVTFEMRLNNVRIFQNDGVNVKTDLILAANLFPTETRGKFIPSVVSVRSEKNPKMTFSYDVIQRLAVMFWEVAAYQINQRNYELVLHYKWGKVSKMELLHPEMPHLSLEDVPLRHMAAFGRRFISELHLFPNSRGEVEMVNAKLTLPNQVAYVLDELNIDPSYFKQWGDGRILENSREVNKPRSPSDWFCAVWIVGIASGAGAAWYLLH